MKNLFIFAVLLSFYTSYGIVRNVSKSTSSLPIIATSIVKSQLDTSVIKSYQHYINKAEVCITKSEFFEASTYYNSAFSLPTMAFAQDIYNASICELELNNYLKTIDYCLMLVDKGALKEFFSKNSYRKLRGNQRHWDEFNQQYPARRISFLAKTDTALVKQIKQMIVADQNFFCERPQRLKDNLFLDSLFVNNQYLSNHLTTLLRKHGYLSEDIIGANFTDTTLSIYPIFNVLIRHHYQLKQYDLSSLLSSAMLEGKLKPELFCSWYNFEKKPIGYGEDFFVVRYKCNLYQARNESIRPKIEANRKAMWLPNLEELKAKLIYKYCSDGYKFIFYAPLSILPKMDEKSEMSFKTFNTPLPNKLLTCN